MITTLRKRIILPNHRLKLLFKMKIEVKNTAIKKSFFKKKKKSATLWGGWSLRTHMIWVYVYETTPAVSQDLLFLIDKNRIRLFFDPGSYPVNKEYQCDIITTPTTI